MSLHYLPADRADATVEALLAERAAPGTVARWPVVILTACALLAVPLVQAPRAIRAPGVIRSAAESQLVRSPRAGMVATVAVREGDPVRVGAVMAELRPTDPSGGGVPAPGVRTRSEELQSPDYDQQPLPVRSPVAGSVERMRVLAGSYVSAGEAVAVVAPNADLFAEVHVTPRQIARLRTGAAAWLRVDAYDWHRWGHASGRVVGIPADVRVTRGQASFVVRVSLERDHLALPDGTRGYLRRGMTLQAHFAPAERGLWRKLRGAPRAPAPGPA